MLTVIKAKKLDVEVDQPEVEKKTEITLTVTGLIADEPLTVMYLGKKLTAATADAAGEFTYTFNVGKEMGEHTVKVIGADPSRTGEADVHRHLGRRRPRRGRSAVGAGDGPP